MPATVFSSVGGRKYHFDKGCKAFESAQMLSDWDCCCGDYCNHRSPVMHGLVRMSSTRAAVDGKLPCLACVPAHLRELPETEDFGHRPVEIQGDHFCTRCRTPYIDDAETQSYPTLWPCTSAIVLGLVPRPTE